MQAVMGTHFLNELASDEIKERLLLPALDGKKIGGICMTEPNAGSDLHGMSTRAERTNEGWKLNGQKMWVTQAANADFFTVFAKVDGEHFTAFLVERDTPGLTVADGHHPPSVHSPGHLVLVLARRHAAVALDTALGVTIKFHTCHRSALPC